MKAKWFIDRLCRNTHEIYNDSNNKDGIHEEKFNNCEIKSIDCEQIDDSTLLFRCNIKRLNINNTEDNLEDIKYDSFNELYRYLTYMAKEYQLDTELVVQCQIYNIVTSQSIYNEFTIQPYVSPAAEKLISKYFNETNIIENVALATNVALCDDSSGVNVQNLQFENIIIEGQILMHGAKESYEILRRYGYKFIQRRLNQSSDGFFYINRYYLAASEKASIEKLSNNRFKIKFPRIDVEVMVPYNNGKEISQIVKWFDLK